MSQTDRFGFYIEPSNQCCVDAILKSPLSFGNYIISSLIDQVYLLLYQWSVYL